MRIAMVAGLTMAAAMVVTSTARAQEKKITRADLPKAVESAVRAQSANGTLRGMNEEQEKGYTYYEAEWRVHGHDRDVLMDSTGRVVEIEEQVSLDSLPAAARDSLNARARGGRILRVEALSKNGHLVAYEAQVRSASGRREIQVGPNGARLAQPQ